MSCKSIEIVIEDDYMNMWNSNFYVLLHEFYIVYAFYKLFLLSMCEGNEREIMCED